MKTLENYERKKIIKNDDSITKFLKKAKKKVKKNCQGLFGDCGSIFYFCAFIFPNPP